MQDIAGLYLDELQAILASWAEPKFRAKQILTWVYKKGAQDFSLMSDLAPALRRKLKDNFLIRGLSLRNSLESSDGTKKLLLGLRDGNLIEGVIIPAEGRVTACLSTQVGCKFACRFCASGLTGFKRNLTAAEIVEEALFLNNYSPDTLLTHIVFMGSGEPLDNYDNLMKAIRIINSPYSLNIGARKVTISTCGIIPSIKKLAEENLQVELSVSLHAVTDKIRSVLIPANKKYPLKELLSTCKDYIDKTNRQVTFEYILIKGLNSDLQSARGLSVILKELRLCKVNLIPANPVKELNVEPPGKLDILLFRDYLLKHGATVTFRKTRGQDIEAACGQLRMRYEKK
jgi:23S rRNA (adenine2503-C2)-methyltransferase